MKSDDGLTWTRLLGPQFALVLNFNRRHHSPNHLIAIRKHLERHRSASPPARFYELIELFDQWHDLHTQWRKLAAKTDEAAVVTAIEETARQFRALAREMAGESSDEE